MNDIVCSKNPMQRKVQTFVPLESELNKEEYRIWMMYFMQNIGTYIFLWKSVLCFTVFHKFLGHHNFV